MALFESEEERAALAAVPAAANIDDLRFFARVAPYFTGRWVRIYFFIINLITRGKKVKGRKLNFLSNLWMNLNLLYLI